MTEHEQVSGLSIYIVVRMVLSCACLGIVKRKASEPARIKAARNGLNAPNPPKPSPRSNASPPS
jgi:hypothetical protein